MGTNLRFGACACALLAATALTAPALAQSSAPPFRNLDGNGVDMVLGDYLLAIEEGSIGSGDGLLPLIRQSKESAGTQWDGISLSRSTSNNQVLFNVTFDGVRERFAYANGVFTPMRANGSTLTLSGGEYIYRNYDHVELRFRNPTDDSLTNSNRLCTSRSTGTCYLLPFSISRPDLQRISLSWDIHAICGPRDSQDIRSCSHYYRLKGVRNNRDYGIAFSYVAASATAGSPPPTNWYNRLSATFNNYAQASPLQATVSYSYPTASQLQITDVGGGVWLLTNGSDNLAIRRPGAVQDTMVISAPGGQVASVTKDGVTTSYTRTVSGSTATMSINQTNGGTTIVQTIVSDLVKGRPTSVSIPKASSDPVTRAVSYSYDGSSRMDRVTHPEGNYVQLNYDTRGNVIQTQHVGKPDSNVPTMVSSAAYEETCTNPVTCNQPISTTNQRNQTTKYTYDGTHGGLTSVTLPAPTPNAPSPQTRYVYSLVNGEYRLTSVCAFHTQEALSGSTFQCAGTSDEVRTDYAYDANGNVTTITRGDGALSLGLTAVTTTTYDPIGNVKSVDGPLSGLGDVTRFHYNGARQLVGVISPDPDGPGLPMKHRAVRNTYVNGLPTKEEFGTANGQELADLNAMVPLSLAETAYDANARPIVRTGMMGGTAIARSETKYDALGRPECSVVRMNPARFGIATDPCTPDATVGGDGPDRVTKIVYNNAGQVVEQWTGVGIANVPAAVVKATYTANGLVESVADEEQNKTTYAYDGHGRLTTTYYPSPIKSAGTSNGNDYEQLTFETTASGTRTSATVASRRLRDGKTIAYSYDALGRVILKDLPPGEFDVTYGYTLLGQPTTVQRAGDGVALSYGYDARGRLTSEGQAFGSLSYQYDLSGRRTRMTWGDGFYVTYDYLNDGTLSAIRENGDTALATYGFDSIGRRTSITRANGTVTSYGYDPAFRLISVGQDLAGTTHDTTTSILEYNPAGQITKQSRSNELYAWDRAYNVNRPYVANGLNQLTKAGTVALDYDGRGNLITSGADVYTYSAENMLKSGPGGVTLSYDPAGRLIEYGTAVSSRFVYDGNEVVGEVAASGAMLRRYVRGPRADEVLVWYEGSGTVDRRYLHADERGSVIAVTNGSGAATSILSYDAFGIPSASQEGVRFGYTGQMWLAELDLYNYKARIYSPSMGRFLQADPIGYGDGMNMYAYVSGDPVNFTDPSGLINCGAGEINVWAPGGFTQGNTITANTKCIRMPGGGGGGGGAAGAGGGGRGAGGGTLAPPRPSPPTPPETPAPEAECVEGPNWSSGPYVGGSAELGAAALGAGMQASYSMMGFGSGESALLETTGAFVGGPGYGFSSTSSSPGYVSDKGGVVIGATIGGGIGNSFSNASKPSDLAGLGQSYNVNLGPVSISATFGENGIFSLNLGASAGFSFDVSTYETNTEIVAVDKLLCRKR